MNNELNQNGLQELSVEEISSVSGAGVIWDAWVDIKKIHGEIVEAVVDAACNATGDC
ncbi:MAG: hypothetical protein HWE27_18580 [Gammaproteobacteria bacterium]|nr:hypothetical protein [Gammaproteobacteria bacterium]